MEAITTNTTLSLVPDVSTNNFTSMSSNTLTTKEEKMKCDDIVRDFSQIHQESIPTFKKQRQNLLDSLDEMLWNAMSWRDNQLSWAERTFQEEQEKVESCFRDEIQFLSDSVEKHLKAEKRKLESLLEETEASLAAFLSADAADGDSSITSLNTRTSQRRIVNSSNTTTTTSSSSTTSVSNTNNTSSAPPSFNLKESSFQKFSFEEHKKKWIRHFNNVIINNSSKMTSSTSGANGGAFQPSDSFSSTRSRRSANTSSASSNTTNSCDLSSAPIGLNIPVMPSPNLGASMTPTTAFSNIYQINLPEREALDDLKSIYGGSEAERDSAAAELALKNAESGGRSRRHVTKVDPSPRKGVVRKTKEKDIIDAAVGTVSGAGGDDDIENNISDNGNGTEEEEEPIEYGRGKRRSNLRRKPETKEKRAPPPIRIEPETKKSRSRKGSVESTTTPIPIAVEPENNTSVFMDVDSGTLKCLDATFIPGDSVILTNVSKAGNDSEIPGVISRLRSSDLWIRIDDGARIKVTYQQLSSGRYLLKMGAPQEE